MQIVQECLHILLIILILSTWHGRMILLRYKSKVTILCLYDIIIMKISTKSQVYFIDSLLYWNTTFFGE